MIIFCFIRRNMKLLYHIINSYHVKIKGDSQAYICMYMNQPITQLQLQK